MTLEPWLRAHARIANKVHGRITMDDKMLFLQQLSTLVSSGTTLLDAIHIAAEQNQSSRLRRILNDVAGHVVSGSALHEAIAGYPHIFPTNWVELMRIGELTGQMGPVLNDLNRQIRDGNETRRQVIGSLVYPMILCLVGVLVVTIMLWFVVPKFEDMFQEMGADLPTLTQITVAASNFIVAYGVLLFVAVVVLAVAFRHYMTTESGRRRVSAVGLCLPVVGELMVQSAMYRFSSNLALLLRSGVPMLQSLSALESIFRMSPLYSEAVAHAERRVTAGRPLADSLEETGLFPSLMANMVRIGEESAQLPSVMGQIAPYYKDKMKSLVSRLTKMLEPAIIVAMGCAMAVLMLSIYLPMFEMSGKVN